MALSESELVNDILGEPGSGKSNAPMLRQSGNNSAPIGPKSSQGRIVKPQTETEVLNDILRDMAKEDSLKKSGPRTVGGKVLKALSRTLSMTTSPVYDVARGKIDASKLFPPSAFKGAINPAGMPIGGPKMSPQKDGAPSPDVAMKESRDEWGKVVKSSKAGFNLEPGTSQSYGDTIRLTGFDKKHPILAGTAAFGLDVAGDVQNLVPVGAMLGVTGKVAKKIPIVGEKLIEPALKVASKVGKKVAKSDLGIAAAGLFNRNQGIKMRNPKAYALAEQFRKNKILVTQKLADKARKMAEVIPDGSRREALAKIAEGGAPAYDNAGRKVIDLTVDELDTLKTVNKDLKAGKVARKASIPGANLSREELFDQYLKEAAKNAGETVDFGKGIIRNAVEGVKSNAALKAADITGDIVDKNLYSRAVEGAGKKLEPVANFLRKINPWSEPKDIAVQYLQKMGKLASDTMTHKHLTELAKIYSKPAALIDKGLGSKATISGYETLSGLSNHIYREIFKNKQVPKHVAAYVTSLDKKYVEESSALFRHVWDNVMNYWKGRTLIGPGFHARNELGNVFNNYLAYDGGLNPVNMWRHISSYFVAADIAKAAKKGGKALDKKVGKYTYKQILEGMGKEGVLNRGAMHLDMPMTARREIINLTKSPLSKDFYGYRWIDTNRAVGEWVEKRGQLAHTVERLLEGKTFKQTAKSVAKYLFDYDNLSYFERTWLKRLYPFYTWQRKNIPLQLETLLKKPQKFATLGKLIRLFEAKGPEAKKAKENMPDYLADSDAFVSSVDKEGKAWAPRLSGVVPFFDIGLSPRDAMSMANPILKYGAENAANQSVTTGREIDPIAQGKPFGNSREQWGSRKHKMYADLPSLWISSALEQDKPLRSLNKMIQGPPLFDFKAAMKGDNPKNSAERRVYDFVKTGGKEGLPSLLQAISGIKTYPYDVGEQVVSRISRHEANAQEIMKVAISNLIRASREGDPEKIAKAKDDLKRLVKGPYSDEVRMIGK